MKMIYSKVNLQVMFVLSVVALNAYCQQLDVETYLSQVREKNDAVKGAIFSSLGSQQRSVEGSLIFTPKFFSEVKTMDDRRETLMPSFQGTETIYSQAEAGVSQVTRYGLAGRVYYGLSSTELFNVNKTYIPEPKFNDSSITLEVSQPLCQNALGSQYRNSEKAVSAKAQAGMYGNKYEAQMLLFGAEIKYWKISAARESIKIISETLERTKHILEFNEKKVSRGLADKSDVLQAQSMLQARNLDLIKARGEERQAAREFNSMRSVDSDFVNEDISLPPLEVVVGLLSSAQECPQMRNDVRAAEMGYKALEAVDNISVDKTKPDVSVYAVTSFNNRNTLGYNAITGTVNSDHIYYVAGLKMSVPIGGPGSEVRSGYSRETEGAKLQFDQKKRDQDSEWYVVTTGMRDTKDSLIAADTLLKAQLAKLENERSRQKDGRSTMFQVFAFEQEYLSSQINIIFLKTKAMSLLAQAKTFKDTDFSLLNRSAK
jgi:outer membrane protein TolC